MAGHSGTPPDHCRMDTQWGSLEKPEWLAGLGEAGSRPGCQRKPVTSGELTGHDKKSGTAAPVGGTPPAPAPGKARREASRLPPDGAGRWQRANRSVPNGRAGIVLSRIGPMPGLPPPCPHGAGRRPAGAASRPARPGVSTGLPALVPGPGALLSAIRAAVPPAVPTAPGLLDGWFSPRLWQDDTVPSFG